MANITLPRLHWGDPDSSRRALLVHGLGSSAQAFWRIGCALADAGWSASAVDLRGHGYAPRGDHYRLSDFAGDLGATHPHGGGAWDVVVGHSIGAATSVLAQHANTSWAKRLVLLDPALLVLPERAEQVITNQRYAHDHLTEEEVRAESPHWHPLEVELRVWSHRTASRFALEQSVLENENWDVVAEAKAITIPTLVIGGDPAVDSMFTGEHAADVLAANPHFRHVVIPGTGHSVQRDNPEDTIVEIFRFAG